jgi:hypothetical protein
MILIWKSNRAKTRTTKRLVQKAGSFPEAVKRISYSLHTTLEAQQRLELLMKGWGFRSFSAELWETYGRFLQAVKAQTPTNLSLRDKDRYLWGRSRYNQVQREIIGIRQLRGT